jgi:hypothetical protein
MEETEEQRAGYSERVGQRGLRRLPEMDIKSGIGRDSFLIKKQSGPRYKVS